MNEVYRDIEKHIPYLRRYAGTLTRNPSAADDLLQDAVVNALSKCHLYRPGTNLRAWLFTILRNQHVSSVRRTIREGIPVEPDDAASSLATRPHQEHGLRVEAVDRALRSLPEGQRRLIEQVALEGWSYEDVAAHHGLALGTVKSRISRGRSQLRQALEERAAANDPRLHERKLAA